MSDRLRPPPLTSGRLSKVTSRCLTPTIGSSTAPVPLPPDIVTVLTSSMSKSCGSTKTSLTLPLITERTIAVVPKPAPTVIFGGVITS